MIALRDRARKRRTEAQLDQLEVTHTTDPKSMQRRLQKSLDDRTPYERLHDAALAQRAERRERSESQSVKSRV
ncbi:hypothetical protein [Opitutus terrae]|uniref:hypothetical protein n=1 Tax=Opitutus terrae TaxID=107709 RepID=UPI0002F7FC8C|nr:hypothetical protein [Opitutus terrae]